MAIEISKSYLFGMVVLATTLVASTSDGDPEVTTSYNTFGAPGLIDMPVATSRPDGELAFTTSYFAGQTRNTLTFQFLPRVSGSFRYSILENLAGPAENPETVYDRSFSLHFRFLDETETRPALAAGIYDVLGTGIYGSEYIVATKSIAPTLRFSAGIGWGRLGTSGGFTNPLGILNSRFETRPARDPSTGGEVNFNQFFRGDAAFFGGIEWQATDRLKFVAEYSSDAYTREDPVNFKRKSQLNFAAKYQVIPGIDLSLNYLYGSEIGVQLTGALNPKNPAVKGGREPAPPPIMPRSTAVQLNWPASTMEQTGLRTRLEDALEGQGVVLHGYRLEREAVRVEIENETYRQEAQAIGRTARVLSRQMPSSVNTFIIVSVSNGLPVSETRISRSDMESLAHDLDGSWKSFTRARITSSTDRVDPLETRYPRFSWGLTPYLETSLFDPDDPFRADVGAQLNTKIEASPGLEVVGTFRKKVLGTLDEATRESDSVLPRVRSEFARYQREGDPAITNLTAAYFFKPGRDLFGRVTVGYLEPMFGGVSSEILWKPIDSRFALGLETNYVKQRDFDQLLGFRNYEVATGHVSAYWDIGNGYHAQVDAGRYLAGDWGATLSLDREFNNGWRIGAFATLTDVPFDEFGEGSFDKGIRISIPIDWLTGEPNKTTYTTTIRPVTRDGGARLDVGGRLYDRVRPLQKPGLEESWGKFWR